MSENGCNMSVIILYANSVPVLYIYSESRMRVLLSSKWATLPDFRREAMAMTTDYLFPVAAFVVFRKLWASRRFTRCFFWYDWESWPLIWKLSGWKMFSTLRGGNFLVILVHVSLEIQAAAMTWPLRRPDQTSRRSITKDLGILKPNKNIKIILNFERLSTTSTHNAYHM